MAWRRRRPPSRRVRAPVRAVVFARSPRRSGGNLCRGTTSSSTRTHRSREKSPRWSASGQASTTFRISSRRVLARHGSAPLTVCGSMMRRSDCCWITAYTSCIVPVQISSWDPASRRWSRCARAACRSHLVLTARRATTGSTCSTRCVRVRDCRPCAVDQAPSSPGTSSRWRHAMARVHWACRTKLARFRRASARI